MTVGTKSVLFGAHCFCLHPFFVAEAWRRLYGFPFDPRLWVAFFVHDLGYLGKPNMDGPEGEQHPILGARLMAVFDGHRPLRYKLLVLLGYSQALPTWETRRGTVAMGRWALLALLHSRFLSKQLGLKPSRLCIADKLAICLTPAWLYLPMTRASGELAEYIGASERREGRTYPAAKYATLVDYTSDEHDWYARMQDYVRRWVDEHKDGREDTWTPSA